MNVWAKIKNFIKKYWLAFVAIIGSIAGYLFGRHKSDGAIESARILVEHYRTQLKQLEGELQSLRGIKQDSEDRVRELEEQLQLANKSIDRIEDRLDEDGFILKESGDLFETTNRNIESARLSINQLRKYFEQTKQ